MPHVYGIQSGLFIKVGIAKSIGARLRDFQLCNPHPCAVIMRRQTRHARWVEIRMHKILEPHAIGREWFMTDVATVRAAASLAFRMLREKLNDDYLWERKCTARREASARGKNRGLEQNSEIQQ